MRWMRQRCSAALEEQLAVIAHAVFKVIISPPAGIQNVTEWSKKEACWAGVSEVAVSLVPALKAELIEKDDEGIQTSKSAIVRMEHATPAAVLA